MTDNAMRLHQEWDAFVSMVQAPPPTTNTTALATVPVTVIGGFLGAGKSTILRHLLTADHGLALSVVVNDLGEVNIDAQLLAAVEADRIELSNGCSCCTLGPDLTRSLLELAGRSPQPDAIIIEASGVGDPTGIATIVAAAPGLRLDGIVTVVDPTALNRLLGDPMFAPLLKRQLDAAHVVALSRVDAIDAAELARVTGQLGELSPGRPVLPVEHGRLDPAVAMSAATQGARPDPAGPPLTLSGISSTIIEIATPVGRDQLIGQLEQLDVVRAKGFVELVEAPGRATLVQMVGRSWSIDDVGPRNASHTVGQLVTIRVD